jgi:hypothetical protein
MNKLDKASVAFCPAALQDERLFLTSVAGQCISRKRECGNLANGEGKG